MKSVLKNALGFSVIYFLFVAFFPFDGVEVTLATAIPTFLCIYVLSVFVQFAIQGYKSQNQKKEQK